MAFLCLKCPQTLIIQLPDGIAPKDAATPPPVPVVETRATASEEEKESFEVKLEGDIAEIAEDKLKRLFPSFEACARSGSIQNP